MNLLFICTGNMYRSAAAFFLAKRRLHATEHRCDSAGVGQSAGGRPMAKVMREILGDYDIALKINDFKSKRVSRELINWADKVIYMTPAHQKQLLVEFPDIKNKLRPLALYHSEHLKKIDDPAFAKSREEVEKIAAQINECVDNLVKDFEAFRA